MFHRECNKFRCCLLRGEDNVAFILSIFVVDDDDRLARRNVGDAILDGVEQASSLL